MKRSAMAILPFFGLITPSFCSPQTAEQTIIFLLTGRDHATLDGDGHYVTHNEFACPDSGSRCFKDSAFEQTGDCIYEEHLVNNSGGKISEVTMVFDFNQAEHLEPHLNLDSHTEDGYTIEGRKAFDCQFGVGCTNGIVRLSRDVKVDFYHAQKAWNYLRNNYCARMNAATSGP